MRVLFISSCYAPPLEGGSVVFLYNIIRNWSVGELVLFTTTRPGSDSFDRSQGYPIVRSPIGFGDYTKVELVQAIVQWYRTLVRMIQNDTFDIIHVGHIFFEGLVAVLLKWRTGLPYILYVYAEELNMQLVRTSLKGKLRRWLYTQIMRRADGVVTVSDYTIALLSKYGVERERIMKVVPMVTPATTARGEEIDRIRRVHNLPQNSRIILTVGRLIDRKGMDVLIRSLPHIREQIPETVLLIAGQGPERGHLENLANTLGVSTYIRFLGFVPEQELPALFDICDLFSLPHRETSDGDTEGCPTVFLEASAHGKAVVGGAAGGVTDAIVDHETGYIVDGTDQNQVATAIINLLKDTRLASEFGRKGRERVTNSFLPELGSNRVQAFSRVVINGLVRP